jgi:predicted AlkP superfamily pyrophosphatase or phosphodiesterase
MRKQLFTFAVILSALLAWCVVPVNGAKKKKADAPDAAAAPVEKPAHLTDRILIISIDGLRPDVLLRARTPRIHALFEAGCFSFWARTTPLAITLPSHTSMLTGVTPRKHEIEWNKDLPLKEPVYPKYPTLFALAKKAGYTTAMIAGKSKFDTLAVPKTLDWMWLPDTTKSEDPDVAEQAVKVIKEHKPQVMFVHFPSNDNVGHKIGWGTPEQIKAVEGADAAVGKVLDALAEAGVADQTIVIVTADHGGFGKTHGPEDARARHIPWIIKGKGIRENVDMTFYPKLEINTEDTFATSCYLLGIPLSPDLDGKPIMEVLKERGELIHTESEKAPG